MQAVIFREKNALCDCCPDLEKHRKNNAMPDMVISTKENSTIFAHRLILGSRFNKVARRLSGPVSRSNTKLNWNAFDHGIIQSLVEFAYTGVIKVSMHNAYQLFLCAWNLGCEFVSTSISHFIVEGVNQNNISLVWTLGAITNCDIINRGCVEFMSANFDQIMSTNLLNRLDVTAFSNVLTHQKKSVSSEEMIIRSITNWIKYPEHTEDEPHRLKHLPELCKLVDWKRISLDAILDLQVNEQYLAPYKIFREEMRKAVKATVNPNRTSGYLLAIGEHSSEDSLDVVKFQYEKPDEVTILGRVEGDSYSKTVSLEGDIFVIGGLGDRHLEKRVSKFNIVTGETHRMPDLLVGRDWGDSLAASLEEVFVCGGDNRGGILKSCEAFNPRRNKWRDLPDLQQARRDLAVAFLPDGRLLATGGSDDGGGVLSSREMLNSASQAESVWRPVAAMRRARCYHAAVYFEGRVFVAGTNGTSEVFTPPPLDSSEAEMGQWTRLSNITRDIPRIRSLVPVSANEIIAFGWRSEVESLQRKASSSSKRGDVEAWNWIPLPSIGHLSCVCGVHFVS